VVCWLACILGMKRPDSTKIESKLGCCSCTNGQTAPSSDDESVQKQKFFKKKNKSERLQKINSTDICSKSLIANVVGMNEDSSHNHIKHPFLCRHRLTNCSTCNNFQSNLSRNDSQGEYDNYTSSKDSKTAEVYALKKNLNLILKELKFLTQKCKDDDDEGDHELLWKFSAMVIDRFCVIVFTVATLISTVAILFTAENFFKMH
jgi:hypothetical protein